MTGTDRIAWLLLAVVVVVSACDAPLGVGLPSTRSLEAGAVTSATGPVEIRGTYLDGSSQYTIDVQRDGSGNQHLVVQGTGNDVEMILVRSIAYFRGRDFLAAHMGTDPGSVNLVREAGDAWWRGIVGDGPNISDLTDAARFRTTFLGSAASTRVDHEPLDGIDAARLSGVRADLYIAEALPNRLLRLVIKKGASIDGMESADLRFTYGNFTITPPPDVIDFSNLSTLPPIYTVVSIDPAGCSSTCVVVATLRNLGGKKGGASPSTVLFTLTDLTTGKALGTCTAKVQPDVDYNETTTAGCTISGLNSSRDYNAATVTAVPTNPGRRSGP